MIHLVIIGSSELARACMVASLADTPDLRAEACTDATDHLGTAPDIFLIQDDPAPGGLQLADQLRILAQRWAGTRIVVLTNDAGPGLELCHKGGVSACLPILSSLDRIHATILLVQAGLIIYPSALLRQSKMIVSRTWRSTRQSIRSQGGNGALLRPPVSRD